MTARVPLMIVALVLLSLMAVQPVVADVKEKDTIKSLEKKTIKVRPGRQIASSNEKAPR